jgi:hypothetical protein
MYRQNNKAPGKNPMPQNPRRRKIELRIKSRNSGLRRLMLKSCKMSLLFKASDVLRTSQALQEARQGLEQGKPEAVSFTTCDEAFTFVDQQKQSLTRAIGLIRQGKTIHYYSYGNFNLVRLILHIIKQTGPVHLFMTSYSFSQKSIERLNSRLQNGRLLSFRVIIDNRVKTMSPKPFQMLMELFDYRCSSIHAKVALLWNDRWKISVITSQNATGNPKLERGTIFTSAAVFDFDLNALEHEFNRGSA